MDASGEFTVNPVEDRVAEILDGEPRRSSVALGSDAADQAFIDGVLGELFRDDHSPSIDQRVSTALSSAGVASRRTPRFVTLAAAILALIALGVALASSSDSELSALERVVRHAELPIERAYHVRIRPRHGSDHEVEAQLYVDGSDRYAVSYPRPQGLMWFGYDGTTSWLVPARDDAPVLVGSGRDAVREWLAARGLRYPLFRVADVLRRVEAGAWQEYASTSDADTVRLLALPGPRYPGAPSRIEIAADRSSGAIRRFTIGWPPSARRKPARCDLELVREGALDRAPYEHAAHHAPDRDVRPIRPR